MSRASLPVCTIIKVTNSRQEWPVGGVKGLNHRSTLDIPSVCTTVRFTKTLRELDSNESETVVVRAESIVKPIRTCNKIPYAFIYSVKQGFEAKIPFFTAESAVL